MTTSEPLQTVVWGTGNMGRGAVASMASGDIRPEGALADVTDDLLPWVAGPRPLPEVPLLPAVERVGTTRS